MYRHRTTLLYNEQFGIFCSCTCLDGISNCNATRERHIRQLLTLKSVCLVSLLRWQFKFRNTAVQWVFFLLFCSSSSCRRKRKGFYGKDICANLWTEKLAPCTMNSEQQIPAEIHPAHIILLLLSLMPSLSHFLSHFLSYQLPLWLPRH